MSASEKNAALANVANGVSIVSVRKAKAQIGKALDHVRFCSRTLDASGKFKFNINPNTLSADYELWVCGSSALYYLMPVSFIRAIYDNPATYIDRIHPEIRVVSVNADAHTVTYAAGGVSSSLQGYLCATL
jgi:hypothetical protein